MSAAKIALLTCCAALLPLAACDTIPRPIEEVPGGGTGGGCTTCHGDASRPEDAPLLQAAPPAGPAGRDPGAHQVHLHAGLIAGAVACTECHVVPTSAAHSNQIADLVFGASWSRDGVTPAFAGGTCTTYCHGASLGGGPAASPAWSSTATLGCGSCHGDPPPSHAASATQCSTCHPGTVDASKAIVVANGLHLNGAVDVGAAHAPGWSAPDAHGHAANGDLASCKTCHGTDLLGGGTGISCDSCHTGGTAAWRTDCTFCHGTPGRAGGYASAPPVGSQGETATTNRAVGAHLAHLAGGGVGPAVACAECHVVPADLAHLNGTPAVTFGAAASRGGASPVWNPGTLGCSATYCHGATLSAGGTNTAPTWTGGAAQAACGTCHATPPPSPHSTSTDCGLCHDGYSVTTVNATTHLDGAVQVTDAHPDPTWVTPTRHGYQANQDGLAGCKSCHGADLTGGTSGQSCNTCHGGTTAWRTNCTFCHGTPGGLASPPVDTQGLSATTQVTVGAHDKHMALTLMPSASVTCATCHAARGDVVTDAAHMDGGNAEVAFTGVAAQGTASTFTRTSDTAATCATYCHGQFAGGATATPSWVSTTDMTCTSCHGAPPPAPHSTSTSCESCHTGYTQTTVNVATHIDGIVQATGGHPAGFSAPTVHGYQANQDGLAGCKSCHGADLTGGTGTSCNTCHGGTTAWRTNCTFCHGTPGGLASPPVDTQGLSARGQVTVGAHARHLALTLMPSASVTCATCHAARGDVVTDAAHMDGGNAEVAFAGVAAQGTASTFTRTSDTAATCATYCHGRFTGGATTASPSWVSTSAMTCTSCHGNAPNTGEHNKHWSGEGIACSVCHGAGYTRTGTTTGTVGAATHLDGIKNIVETPTGTGIRDWDGTNCTASCHGSETW